MLPVCAIFFYPIVVVAVRIDQVQFLYILYYIVAPKILIRCKAIFVYIRNQNEQICISIRKRKRQFNQHLFFFYISAASNSICNIPAFTLAISLFANSTVSVIGHFFSVHIFSFDGFFRFFFRSLQFSLYVVLGFCNFQFKFKYFLSFFLSFFIYSLYYSSKVFYFLLM